MADQGEKRHEATEGHLRRKRDDGQWYRSGDLTTARILAAMALIVGSGMPAVGRSALDLFETLWNPERLASPDPLRTFDASIRESAATGALMVGGILLTVLVVAVLTQFLQVGAMFSTTPLWKPGRLNPAEGFKEKFLTGATYQKLAINLVKAAVLLGIAAEGLRSGLNPILFSARIGPLTTGSLFHGLFSKFLWQVAIVSLLFGGVDYMIERHRFLEQSKMNDEERKQDQKNSEGNVEAKKMARLSRFNLARIAQQAGRKDQANDPPTLAGLFKVK